MYYKVACIITALILFNHVNAQLAGEMYAQQIRTPTELFYRIHVKILRNCASTDDFPKNIFIINNDDPANQSPVSLRLTTDSIGTTTNGFNDPCKPLLFTTDPCMGIYYMHADFTPGLNKNGYRAIYKSCCRDYDNILLDPRAEKAAVAGMVLTATMKPVLPLFDNSNAYFNEDSVFVTCKGQPFSFQLTTTDPDDDSVAYRFANARSYGYHYEGLVPTLIIHNYPPYPFIFYQSPYDVPLPMGEVVEINSKTGEITGTINKTGKYLLTVEVPEYRNGVEIASHQKDIPLMVVACDSLPKPTAILPEKIDGCNNYTFSFPVNVATYATYYSWDFGDGATSSDKAPKHTYTDTGTYIVRQIINPGYSCADTAYCTILVYPGLKASYTYTDSCLDKQVRFYNTSVSPYGQINKVQWSVKKDDGSYYYTNTGHLDYNFPADVKNNLVTIEVENNKGCKNADSNYVVLYKSPAQLPVHDTILAMGIPFTIPTAADDITATSAFSWWPATGLDNPYAKNPVVNMYDNIIYHADIKSIGGCAITDTIRLQFYKGPDVYVPSAFTPNGDGLNDKIKLIAAGLKKTNGFTIFNRNGQKVFETRGTNAWDGSIKGIQSPAGVYVWVFTGTDFNDKPFKKSGTIVLIR